MPAITTLFGLVLIALGLLFRFGLSAESNTALIPSVLGVVVAVLGIASFRKSLRQHMIHGALLVAVIGVGAVALRLPQTFAGGTAKAMTQQTLMLALCAGYIALGVRSFITARRKRRAERAAAKVK